MESQKMLSIAAIAFKVVLILNIVAIVVLIFITIHSNYSPKTYEKLIVKEQNSSFTLWYSSTISSALNYEDWQTLKSYGTNVAYFTQLDLKTRIRIVFVQIVQIILAMLVIKELINFIGSLKNYRTIFVLNYFYFKRISIYLIGYIIFTIINSVFPIELKMSLIDGIPEQLSIGDTVKTISTNYYSFYLDFKMVIFLIISILLSLVFKEGERLRIENELTI